MKKALFLLIVPLLIIGGSAKAQSVLPAPGLTPASPFYFMDRFGEWLREKITFNPESKIKLQMELAAERVAEVKVLLEVRGIEAKGLEVAQDRLQEHIAKATDIIEIEKQDGKDVSALAGNVVDNFRIQKKEIKDAFKNAKDVYLTKKKQLQEELRVAIQLKDSTAEENIRRVLDDIEAAKEEAEAQKDAAFTTLEAGKENLLDALAEDDLAKEKELEDIDEEIEIMAEAIERQIKIEEKQFEQEIERLKKGDVKSSKDIKLNEDKDEDDEIVQELKAQEAELIEEESVIDEILKLVE